MSEQQVDFGAYEQQAIKDAEKRLKDQPVDVKKLAGKMVKGIMENKYISRSLILFLVYIILIGLFSLITSLSYILFLLGLIIGLSMYTKFEVKIKGFIQWLKRKR